MSLLKASVENINLNPGALNEFDSGLSLSVGLRTKRYLQIGLGTERKRGGN